MGFPRVWDGMDELILSKGGNVLWHDVLGLLSYCSVSARQEVLDVHSCVTMSHVPYISRVSPGLLTPSCVPYISCMSPGLHVYPTLAVCHLVFVCTLH